MEKLHHLGFLKFRNDFIDSCKTEEFWICQSYLLQFKIALCPFKPKATSVDNRTM